MTLLSAIQDVTATFSLSNPTTVIGNDDEQVRQLLGLANEEGKSLARRFAWQRLLKEGTFTTVAAETQSTLIAATGGATFTDYGLYVPDTMWNRTKKWRVFGPYNSQQWQAVKASGLDAGVYSTFRIRGDSILFYPTPTAGESIYFEYISKNWNKTAGGQEQSRWANDDDTYLLDEELLKLGVKWRFLRAKGLSYGEEFSEYEHAVAKVASHDGARTILDLNDGFDPMSVTIPEGSWDLDA